MNSRVFQAYPGLQEHPELTRIGEESVWGNRLPPHASLQEEDLHECHNRRWGRHEANGISTQWTPRFKPYDSFRFSTDKGVRIEVQNAFG